MYSLYRAWLTMSQQTSVSGASSSSAANDLQNVLPLNLSAPLYASPGAHQVSNTPDVQLQVGPSLTNFSAHRNVLSAHSGFFKAALSNGSGPILVPNIQVDEFSSLLTFMYTGYLDLNLSNIYNILLATHILHMPRALELCRSFLLQTQTQQHLNNHPSVDTRPSSIIKPIASRKPLPQLQYELPIGSGSKQNENPANESIPSLKFTSSDSVFKKINTRHPNSEENVNKMAEHASTSTSDAPRLEKREKCENKKTKRSKTEGDASTKLKPNKKRSNSIAVSSTTATTTSTSTDDRVIIDIACCDGPVRFHRVINKNYGQKLQPVDTFHGSKSRKRTEEAMNKVMTENIKLGDVSSDNVEVFGEENATTTANNDLYTCLYCNHTFKSQYCYQKHARRHLNPVDAPVKEASTTPRENKREFKLLDMNVQYYPCKTCGSKFPSYYFVHKHRKLCHADEMADGNNKNNEIVQVKPKTAEDVGDVEEKTMDIDVDVENENIEEQIKNGDLVDKHSSSSCHSNQSNNSDIIDVEETN